MIKKIYEKEKILGIILVVLTIFSFFIDVLNFTNMIYSCSFDTSKLNHLLVSIPSDIFLWVDNILIYLFAILYIISAVQSKKDTFIKVSFSIFSILTTIVMFVIVINFIARLFGIY